MVLAMSMTVLLVSIGCDSSPLPLTSNEKTDTTTASVSDVTYIFEGTTYIVSYSATGEMLEGPDTQKVKEILSIPSLVTIIEPQNKNLYTLYPNSEEATKAFSIAEPNDNLLAKRADGNDVAASNGLYINIYAEKNRTGAWQRITEGNNMPTGNWLIPDHLSFVGSWWDNKISSLFAYNPVGNRRGLIQLHEKGNLDGGSFWIVLQAGQPLVINNLKYYGMTYETADGTVTIPWIFSNWDNAITSMRVVELLFPDGT